jgi:ppGpp synthetase/RelA/SpoT-type nucleotidyltranferase
MAKLSGSIETHGRQDLYLQYENKVNSFNSLMNSILSILNKTLPSKMVVATTSRIKDFDSFYEKANRLRDGKLKYNHPLEQIKDLVGIRIVVIAQRNVADVCGSVKKTLEVLEEEDKAAELLKQGQLGYESYHLICKLGSSRAQLSEYTGICDQPFEIQVRTALQHAWAENEHRIQYKKSKNPELQKRFLRLAAAISSADEEFDRIYELNERFQSNAVAANIEVPQSEDVPQELGEVDSSLSEISQLFGKRPTELVAEGRYSEAIQVYDRFIKAQPKQVSHFVGRAKARALSGDVEGGINDLETAKSIAREHPATKALQRFFDRILDGNEQ